MLILRTWGEERYRWHSQTGIIGSGGWMMQFVIGQSTNVSSRNNHLEPKGEGNNLETRTVSESEANYKFWNVLELRCFAS